MKMSLKLMTFNAVSLRIAGRYFDLYILMPKMLEKLELSIGTLR